jgi:spore coat polysaccharide biosynthesis protein SpsF
VSNIVPDRTFPRGLDTEVMSFEALTRAWRESREEYDREHVTPWIYREGSDFTIDCIRHNLDLSHHRWTLDTPDDLAFLQLIYDHFGGDEFSWQEVLALLERHPEWLEINRSGPGDRA